MMRFWEKNEHREVLGRKRGLSYGIPDVGLALVMWGPNLRQKSGEFTGPKWPNRCNLVFLSCLLKVVMCFWCNYDAIHRNLVYIVTRGVRCFSF